MRSYFRRSSDRNDCFYLFENPVINVQRISEHLDCTFATASKLVDQFEQLELLRETTGQKRNRQYEYTPYMKFWKTAQDDFGNIATAEAQTEALPIDLLSSLKFRNLR